VNIDFDGQVVLITGATRGIGRQLAMDFSQSGAQLILTGTGAPRPAGKLGVNRRQVLDYHQVDFTEPQSMSSFIAALAAYSKIDVCINNAGINRIASLDEVKLDDWRDVMAVNLGAPFQIARTVSAVMKRNGYGRIVNVGSIYGVISRERRTAYSMTKFGLRGLTAAASNELARHNVLVNTVSPGFVRTDLTASILTKRECRVLEAQIPARRFATPRDISPVVMFLASRTNTYVTGQNVIVDGGYVNV
jgi:3-oxoacyl-[acyl-carrier protein] reductase